MGTLTRGLVAGAVGTLALNAATYLDMAVRGRPASDTPERSVEAIAGALGADIPGKGDERANRLTGIGALSGMYLGVEVGVSTSVAHSLGLRLPLPLGVLATGAAAMAAADVPMGLLGVSDPREWSAQEWVADAVPHLAYGLATQLVLRQWARLERAPEEMSPPHGPSFGLVMRSLLLGVAAGGRGSLGLAAPVVSTPRTPAGRLDNALIGAPGSTLLTLAGLGELVVDKLPSTPSRLEPPALAGRVASGALGAAILARRENANGILPLVFGAAGAVAGSFGGAAWRSWADRRLADWQAALVEDGVAVLLAAVASAPNRRAAR